MRKYATEIRAIDPLTGEMARWCGPTVEAITWGMAEKYCIENGLGYCKIVGELIAEGTVGGNDTIHYDFYNN